MIATARGRTVRWAGFAGLLAAGAIGGGVLMGAVVLPLVPRLVR